MLQSAGPSLPGYAADPGLQRRLFGSGNDAVRFRTGEIVQEPHGRRNFWGFGTDLVRIQVTADAKDDDDPWSLREPRSFTERKAVST